MLLAFGRGIPATRWIGTGWLRIFGRCSYEIYIFHMLVVLGLMELFKRRHVSVATIPLWYVAMLLLILLLGCMVARLYSEPLNRWLRSRAQSAPALAVSPTTKQPLR